MEIIDEKWFGKMTFSMISLVKTGYEEIRGWENECLEKKNGVIIFKVMDSKIK